MEALREQWLILISTPVYLFFIGLEILLSRLEMKPVYTWKDSLTNLYFMLLNGGLDLLLRGVYLLVLSYSWQFRFFEIENPYLYWIALLLAEDFMYYWLHRFDHQIRLFWAVHVTHHSSEQMNLSVGFRSSVLQPLYRIFYFIPLALLGFRPMDILFIYAVTQIWGILVHTRKVGKLGWWEYLLVTPSHHRVHHASNPLYLDKNMGMFLIIWDRLFGTFQEELPEDQYQPIKYGLTTSPGENGALGLVFHEWIQLVRDLRQPGLSLKERWMYLAGPPGWSHDGSRLTSEQLREREKLVE
jgi:sterol desaturase/sphingolipid hydroxylase (fatty acid hydroxylase superfamily)